MRVEGDPEQPSARSGRSLITFWACTKRMEAGLPLPAAPDIQRNYLWGGPDSRQSCWDHHHNNRDRAQNDLLSH